MKPNALTKGPVAIVKYPQPNNEFITYAKLVLGGVKNNPSFPNPDPPIAQIEGNINALDEAELMVATRVKGAAAARNAKKMQVIYDIDHLCDYVNGVVQKIPDVAARVAVIESANMSVKKVPQRSTPDLSAKSTGVSGEVALTAKSQGPTTVYYWEHSPDQVAWSAAPETLKASTTIAELPWAKMRYFRYRTLSRAGKSDYSQVVGVLVQ